PRQRVHAELPGRPGQAARRPVRLYLYGARPGPDAGGEHGRAAGGGAGQPTGAAVHRARAPRRGRGGRPRGAGGQGRHLRYVRRFKPAAVIDIATLTGAVVVALGQVAMGMMGNDDALLAEVREAGERAGERCWPLPLWDEYRDLLKSDIADMKNSGGRGAGSIAGGWFLREFMEGVPW